MKSETTLNPAVRRGRRATTAILVLGLFMTGAAHAQWVVSDPAHTAKNVAGWIEKHNQDLKEIQKWKDELNHYKQQLADANKVFNAQEMSMTMDFVERRLDYGMKEQCPQPKKSGGHAGGASDSITSNAVSFAPAKVNMDGDIGEEQLKLCQQVVFLQNSKYNELVKVLRTIQQRDSELKNLDTYRNGVGTSEGKLATSSNQISAFAARTQMDMQYAQTVIATYDGYIGIAKKDMQELTKRANNGSEKTMLNAVMQGVVLKGTFAAFRAARAH